MLFGANDDAGCWMLDAPCSMLVDDGVVDLGEGVKSGCCAALVAPSKIPTSQRSQRGSLPSLVTAASGIEAGVKLSSSSTMFYLINVSLPSLLFPLCLSMPCTASRLAGRVLMHDAR